MIRVAIFREKKLFRGTRNRRNFYSFRRNSVCFAERKTLGIPFRAIPRKIKKAQNSVPNHFLKKKNTRNLVISFKTIPRKIKRWNTGSETGVLVHLSSTVSRGRPSQVSLGMMLLLYEKSFCCWLALPSNLIFSRNSFRSVPF